MTNREFKAARRLITKIRRSYDPKEVSLNFLHLKRFRRGLVNRHKGALPQCWEVDYKRQLNQTMPTPKGKLP